MAKKTRVFPKNKRFKKSTRRNGFPRVIKKTKKQSGSRKSVTRDRQRRALPPGLRRSKSGRLYWETRKNHSDLGKTRI